MTTQTRWSVSVGSESTSAVYERTELPQTRGLLVLGHGASTNVDHRTPVRLAEVARGRGLDTVRYNFLYTEKGSGPPDRMPRLMECLGAVADRARTEIGPRRLLLGGHSMGGRAASMFAAEGGACDGLILFAYPLHPSGQPEKLRHAHLPSIPVPTLCLSGTRDPLCEKPLMEEVRARLSSLWTMHWIEGADHSFAVQKRSGRTDADVTEEIGDAIGAWLRDLEN